MSNLGLERYLTSIGLHLVRTRTFLDALTVDRASDCSDLMGNRCCSAPRLAGGETLDYPAVVNLGPGGVLSNTGSPKLV